MTKKRKSQQTQTNTQSRNINALDASQRSIWKRVLVWLSRISGIAAAIAAGIYTYYAAKQWHTASATLAEMKAEQRPVVGISGFNVLFENEAPDALLTKVILHYVNGGKSTAINCQRRVEITAGKLPQPESPMAIPVPNECLDNAPHLLGVGGPNLITGVENQHTINAPTDLAQYWTQISKGTIRLYLVGCIDYDFGKDWFRSHICMVYLPDQRTFEFCPGGGTTIRRTYQ